MLRGIGPDLICTVDVDIAREDGPEDDGDEKGVGGDGGVEEMVEGLERTGETIQEGGSTIEGVGEGVNGSNEEVER